MTVNINLELSMVDDAVIVELGIVRQENFWNYKVRSCLKKIKIKSFNIFYLIK